MHPVMAAVMRVVTSVVRPTAPSSRIGDRVGGDRVLAATLGRPTLAATRRFHRGRIVSVDVRHLLSLCPTVTALPGPCRLLAGGDALGGLAMREMTRSVTTGLASLLGATHSGHRWHRLAMALCGTPTTGGSATELLAALAGMGLFDVLARSGALLPTDPALLGHGGSP